jgi:hypothetical protein
LKLEKDQQRNKEKKSRDAFLLMLAENVDIDSRSRWRDAIPKLQNDHRYKNVEDAREREELFNVSSIYIFVLLIFIHYRCLLSGLRVRTREEGTTGQEASKGQSPQIFI